MVMHVIDKHIELLLLKLIVIYRDNQFIIIAQL